MQGLIVPAYFPTTATTDWDKIRRAACYLGKRLIVIINPNNGPSTNSGDISFHQSLAADLHALGSKVIGYVKTCWANQYPHHQQCFLSNLQNKKGYEQKLDDTKKTIATWHQYYSVDGLFFDEVSDSTSPPLSIPKWVTDDNLWPNTPEAIQNWTNLVNNESPKDALKEFYGPLHQHAKTVGTPSNILAYNYGTIPSEDFYKDLVGAIHVIFERPFSNFASWSTPQYVLNGDQKRFAVIAHSTPTMPKDKWKTQGLTKTQSNNIGWVYFFEKSNWHYHESLFTYFDSLADEVASPGLIRTFLCFWYFILRVFRLRFRRISDRTRPLNS